MSKNHPSSIVLCELGDGAAHGVESYSPFCLKVHRALQFKGISYSRHFASDPGEYKSINPAEQAPVLLIDGAPVADSSAILRAIEPLGGRRLVPSDPRVASEAWLWEELADTALNGFVVAARWLDDDNWPRVREAYFGGAPAPVRAFVAPMVRKRVRGALHARDVWRAGADACWARFDRLLDDLEARAPREGAWVGDALSIADVAIFGQLQSLRTDLTKGQRAKVEAHAHLTAYLDRVDRETRVSTFATARAA
jgi:glutathione S-transferase